MIISLSKALQDLNHAATVRHGIGEDYAVSLDLYLPSLSNCSFASPLFRVENLYQPLQRSISQPIL